MLTDKVGRPGDIKRVIITLDGIDISSGVIATHIWQDIFTASWSCKLIVGDTTNMIHTLPIKQGMEIGITLETELTNKTKDAKQFKFILFAITDRTFEKSRFQSYALEGVSKSFIKNQQKRVSKHYSDTPDQIVSKIVSDKLGGTCKTSSAGSKIDVIIPNLSPIMAANFVCKFAKAGQAADCVFFMTDDDEYIMESVEKLYTSDEYKSGWTLLQGEANAKDTIGNQGDEVVFYISGYTFEHYDALMNMTGGFYANQVVTYDFTKKKWEERNFKHGDDISSDHSMSTFSGSVFDDSKLANQSFIPKYDMLFDKKASPFKSDNLEDWVGSRKSSMLKLEQDRLFVQIPGNVIMWQALGKNIEIDLPSHEDMTGETLDKYYKGTYLITAVHHTVQGTHYNVNLELVKKRLAEGM